MRYLQDVIAAVRGKALYYVDCGDGDRLHHVFVSPEEAVRAMRQAYGSYAGDEEALMDFIALHWAVWIGDA
jgi:hypothetical protein